METEKENIIRLIMSEDINNIKLGLYINQTLQVFDWLPEPDKTYDLKPKESRMMQTVLLNKIIAWTTLGEYTVNQLGRIVIGIMEAAEVMIIWYDKEEKVIKRYSPRFLLIT